MSSGPTSPESDLSARFRNIRVLSRAWSSFLPSPVSHHRTAISASVWGTGSPLDWRMSRSNRKRFRTTFLAGCPSASSGTSSGATLRSSSTSVSVNSSTIIAGARPSFSMASTGSQFGSSVPNDRRAVTTTLNQGTLAASRTRSLTVARSASLKKSRPSMKSVAPPEKVLRSSFESNNLAQSHPATRDGACGR